MARVWFVTGSSRGLGLALVEAILAAGDRAVVTARNSDYLSHLVEKYGSERVLTVSLDVTNNSEVIHAVDLALKTFGRLDICVNNAGYADTASGSGHIIQISSVGGRVGTPGLSAYQSAKWAIGGFSTVPYSEVGALGIKVTVLEPGGMKTNWAGSSMCVGPISEPYQQTVRAFLELRDRPEVKDNWASPSKVADLIIHVSKLEEPPLRLLAGRDTVEYAKRAADALRASDEKFHSLTASTS